MDNGNELDELIDELFALAAATRHATEQWHNGSDFQSTDHPQEAPAWE